MLRIIYYTGVNIYILRITREITKIKYFVLIVRILFVFHRPFYLYSYTVITVKI